MLISAALLLNSFLLAFAADEPLRWTPPATNQMRDISDFLKPFQEKFEFPALAAAVLHEKQIIAAAAVGERKIGSGVRVQLSDSFHIGSCTKSFTALLAIDLVRKGTITLDTRVGDVFPEFELDAPKRDITLELLLQNRSGIAAKPEPQVWARAFELKGPPSQQRRDFLRGALAQPLVAAPRTKYLYSNVGYALAGAMLEQKAGHPWEDLVRDTLFARLRLISAGFGPPSYGDSVDNPWGHQRRGQEIVALPPQDNPTAIAPAGLIHMSILDLARYAAFQLDLFNGKVPELSTFRDKMYTPPADSDYAFGWIVQKRNWAGGTVLTHSGSNTMFYAVIWLAPLKDYAFVVATNIGDQDVAGGATARNCDEVVAALIREYIR
jgi:CubicO group peptidase (beta-lactamase class C family)